MTTKLTTRKTRPLDTTTKTASRQVEAYARCLTDAKRGRLTEIAQRDGHGERWVRNRLDKIERELDAIRAAGNVERVNISVEWHRSPTWGMNPSAEVYVSANGEGHRYTGTASRCGYDKESAAVAEALNQSPALQRLLIVLAARKVLPYGARVDQYGAHFSGGVGVGCFRDIFRAAGYTWDGAGHGKSFDAYTVTR